MCVEETVIEGLSKGFNICVFTDLIANGIHPNNRCLTGPGSITRMVDSGSKAYSAHQLVEQLQLNSTPQNP